MPNPCAFPVGGVKRKSQHIPCGQDGLDPTENSRGILADFIARMRDEGCEDEVDPVAFSLVMTEVSRETLYCQMMDVLTAYWKKMEHPLWEFPGRAALLQRCIDIAANKRQAACLRAAVETECTLRRLLTKPAFHRDETSIERRVRVEGFWEHYTSRETHHFRERSSEEWRSRQRPALSASTVTAGLLQRGELLEPLEESKGRVSAFGSAPLRDSTQMPRLPLGSAGHLDSARTSQTPRGLLRSARQLDSARMSQTTRGLASAFPRDRTSRRGHEFVQHSEEQLSLTSSVSCAMEEAAARRNEEAQQNLEEARETAAEAWEHARRNGDPASAWKDSAAPNKKGFLPDCTQGVLDLPRRLLSSKTAARSRPGTRPGTNPARRRKMPCVDELQDILPSKPSGGLPDLLKGTTSRPGTTSTQPSRSRRGTAIWPGAIASQSTTAAGGGLSSKPSPWSSILPSQTSSTTSLASSRFELPPLKYEPPRLGTPLEMPESPRMQYLKTCHHKGIAPMSIPFITGHSSKFTVSEWALRDRHLIPITDMAMEMERVDEVDLSHNAQLTDKALVPFLATLCRKETPTLLRLSLSHCTRLGTETLKTIMSSLWQEGSGLQSLRELDLSGLHIPMKSYMSLSEALGTHCSLKDLRLTDTHLGSDSSAQSSKVIENLLKSPTLEVLDIGWSILRADVFAHLGACLHRVKQLRSLYVPNCSATSVTHRDFPVEHFLEKLGKARTLTRLDVSLNHIDYRGALIMEDALERHPLLRELIITENHLGVAGIRSLLRTLARDTSGLHRLDFEGCAAGSMSPADMDSHQAWKLTNPGGRYVLDLKRPYHRAFTRMLYKACEDSKYDPSTAFTDVVFHPPPYKHPSKDETGIFQVPSQGKLALTFNVLQGAVGQQAAKSENLWDFASFLEKRNTSARLQPSFRKVVPLFANWKNCQTKAEKMAMLDAIASDFLLTFPQVQELGEEVDLLNEVLCRTMHCLTGGQPARYLSMLLTPSIGHYMHNYNFLRNLFGFNPENPTWHYVLELGSHPDYAVAEQLLLLDRWEVEVERHLGRVDVSQWGNRSHVRNMEHQGRALHVTSAAEWNMPTYDLFECDYTSGKRPPTDTNPIDDSTFNKMLQLLEQNDLDSKVQIDVLKQIASHTMLKSLQLRELLGVFCTDALRADVFAVFYFRVTDMQNEKVFRVRFDDREELDRLRNRLGYATFFPFIQPEHANFTLDWQYHDQRMAANILFQLMMKEQVGNLKNPQLTHADGTLDPLPLGIPRSWEVFEKMPKTGVFRATYCSAPEDRHFKTRKEIFEKYGHWKCFVPEHEVLWWSALTEAPTDVNEFMEYIVANFINTQEAFTAFDGVDGNGVITLHEFQDGLELLHCRKFEGPDKEHRIREVFRYLDPSGEGGVSEAEWQILDQLWKEMMTCLTEFVGFIGRAFDYDDGFLQMAWDTLDEDGSGEISEDEWVDVVKNRLKYFGPSEMIFHFLDKDDEGTLSFDEFEFLETFLENAHISEKRASRLAAGSSMRRSACTLKDLADIQKVQQVAANMAAAEAAASLSRGSRVTFVAASFSGIQPDEPGSSAGEEDTQSHESDHASD